LLPGFFYVTFKRMNRRTFLKASLAVTLGSICRAAEQVPADIRITRIVAFELQTKRNKLAGKNSRLDVHGDKALDWSVRLFTNNNLEGVGVCWADKKEALAPWLGRPLSELFDFQTPKTRNVRAPLTMPLWDLAGKILNKPVYELLGGKSGNEPRRVRVYDGSIYFADLLPQYADNWQDEFKREIDLGLALGHRGFKIKIGRGAKWMPRDEGDARDVAVVKTIRQHAGKDVLLGVDANNGYDLAGAKRFIESIGDANLAFTEEMFPEEVEQCLAYKQFLRERKLDTLLADGETQKSLEVFEPFIKAQAIDVLQGDMNHFGIEGIMQEAAMGRPQGVKVAPHNWGSLMGFYQELQVGCAIENFYAAEHDPLTSDYLIAEGVKIADGYATVPQSPGFGLRIDEARFASAAKIRFEMKT
jgi:L-alanine-DL-glutamate epimerase-like enolase superfamily enzyme